MSGLTEHEKRYVAEAQRFEAELAAKATKAEAEQRAAGSAERANYIPPSVGGMTLADAVLHVLVSAPFEGRRVGDVAETDAGLLELERLSSSEAIHGLDRLALEVFCADREVRHQLEQARERARAASFVAAQAPK